ncbi:hypothetical protein SNARM312S_03288 [Streptomyces narbonensis]
MAAEVEEAVVDADRLHAERLGEQPAQGFLAAVPGPAHGCGVRADGPGQTAAVELAAGAQGQFGEADELSGHHVGGQSTGEVVAQRVRAAQGAVGVARGGRVLRVGLLRLSDDIGDEALVAGPVLADHDGGLPDTRVAGEHGGDLAELDAEASDLHLVVGTAEELHHPVAAPLGEVAGAVHAAAGRPEGGGGEAFRGEARPAQVPPGELDAGEVELAGHSRRHGPQSGVQDVHAGVPDGPADGDGDRARRSTGAGPVEAVGGHVDGRLGGAVQIVQFGGADGGEPFGEHGGQGLAAADDAPQGAAGADVGGAEERLQHRGDEVGGGDGVPLAQAGQVVGVLVALGPGDDQGGAGDQRPEELPDGDVEAGRGLLQDAFAGFESVGVLHPEEPVHDRVVGDDDALGPAGGARGVDDVGGVSGQGLGQVVYGVGGGGGFEFGEESGGEDEGGRGVVEHVGDAVPGVVGVDGQVGGAGLVHGVQGDDQLDRSGQGDGDDAFGAGAVGHEVAGEVFGAGVERGVVEALVFEEDGGGPGCAAGLFGEEPGQGGGGDGDGGVVPVVADLVVFLVGEEVDGAEGLVGVLGESGEQDPETMADALHGGVVEEVGGVSERPVETRRTTFGVVPLLDPHRQVELRDPGADGDHLGAQAGHGFGLA